MHKEIYQIVDGLAAEAKENKAVLRGWRTTLHERMTEEQRVALNEIVSDSMSYVLDSANTRRVVRYLGDWAGKQLVRIKTSGISWPSDVRLMVAIVDVRGAAGTALSF